MDVDRIVSLLRYAKGDMGCRIMHLIFHPNYQERTSWGTASSAPLGAKVTVCFGHQADLMRKYRHGPLWPKRRRRPGSSQLTGPRPEQPVRLTVSYVQCSALTGQSTIQRPLVGYGPDTSAPVWVSSWTPKTSSPDCAVFGIYMPSSARSTSDRRSTKRPRTSYI